MVRLNHTHRALSRRSSTNVATWKCQIGLQSLIIIRLFMSNEEGVCEKPHW